MRILVTGCAGRVGMAASRYLAEVGHDIVGLDVREPGEDLGIDARVGDLTADGVLGTHLRDVDTVLHLAAIPVPRAGTPEQIFDLNCAGTFRLFQACVDGGIQHVVVASSINAIGYYFGVIPFEIDYLPVDEEHPCHPSDAYSFSKQITEQIGGYFCRRESVTSLCLRFGAGLAPEQELRQQLGSDIVALRQLVQGLHEADPVQAAAEVQRMRSVWDAARQARASEPSPELSEQERRLMGWRHNYFSFVELGQACLAMEAALVASVTGSRPLFIVDQHNILGLPAEELAALLYPDVARRQPLQADQSLVDWRRATQLLGFTSTVAAADLLI